MIILHLKYHIMSHCIFIFKWQLLRTWLEPTALSLFSRCRSDSRPSVRRSDHRRNRRRSCPWPTRRNRVRSVTSSSRAVDRSNIGIDKSQSVGQIEAQSLLRARDNSWDLSHVIFLSRPVFRLFKICLNTGRDRRITWERSQGLSLALSKLWAFVFILSGVDIPYVEHIQNQHNDGEQKWRHNAEIA